MQPSTEGDVCCSPHAPGPLSERQSLVLAPSTQPGSSPADATPSHLRTLTFDLPPQPPARAESQGFKFSPAPMCYHSRKRSSDQPNFLFQQRTDSDSEDSPKKQKPIRVKTVSFSTGLQTETERSIASEDKENQEVDLTDSLEVVSTVATGLPQAKTSVSSSYVVWRRAGTVPLAENSGNEMADSIVRAPNSEPLKPQSSSARTSPVRVSTPLFYCPACDRDCRTFTVFESVPQRGLQRLMCCWSGIAKNQVMTVHKCVKCKRVIARLVQ